MVEFKANGNIIELPLKGAEIKYTIQIADIFDLAKVSNSFTNSFVAPKTPNNTQTLEGLGISGDTSTIPYSKIDATLKDDGFTLIENGWLNISETTDNYKLSIINGMIDFFKAIESKTLGVDLDLSNFEHKKDLPTVLTSKDNEFYTYIFADFGGNNIGRVFGTTDFRILIDYQVPSFSVRKLFDLVFSTFGFTWESERMEAFLDGLWITYPTPPTYVDSISNLIATLNKAFYSTNKLITLGNRTFAQFEQEFDATTITEGNLIDNKIFQVPESSGYNIKIKTEAYLLYRSSYGSNIYLPAKVVVQRNGVDIIAFDSDPYAPVERELNLFLNANDNITYLVYADQIEKGSGEYSLRLNKITHNSTKIEIKKVNQGEVSPLNAFKNFKITDFFKEILWRTGLIPRIDRDNKITFYHVDELVDFENAIDWSDKFIVRKKETYLQNSYSQRNLFKMKYNENQAEVNDGVLLVDNKNIDEERILAQSVMYSPEQENGFFLNRTAESIYVPILKQYQSEVKQTDSGIETNYKTLDNRFYFLRKNNIVDNLGLISYEIPATENVSDWNFASVENTLLGQLVDKNFKEYSKIFNNFKAHEIELNLSLIDIIELDLTRPYYIKKEGQYYILNKITFQKGQTTIGEFIRINK